MRIWLGIPLLLLAYALACMGLRWVARPVRWVACMLAGQQL